MMGKASKRYLSEKPLSVDWSLAMNTLVTIGSGHREVPNMEVLRSQGWSVNNCHGRYCVAWQSPNQEVLLVWREDGWYRVHGGSPVG